MKKTPLYDWHVENGANMAQFGSYIMPMWYPQGAKQEHLTVISGAGLFDTSHMAVVLVAGEDSRALLQHTFSKNIDCCLGRNHTPLVNGRCVYGVFLHHSGYVLDDAIVYQISDTRYMVVVNASMGAALVDHLTSCVEGMNVTFDDFTDKLGKIDCQGPSAAKILSHLLKDPQGTFDNMCYFSFKGWFDENAAEPLLLKDGTPVLLSRTGYTGEFGFELFLLPQHVDRVWNDLLQAGSDDIVPCGLASRDSLRAGAALPLSHQDIGEWYFINNPWTFALPLDTDGGFSKKFIGAEGLKSADSPEYTYPFAGFDPRKIPLGENSSVLGQDGEELGTILTCATDMAIGRVDGRIVSIATRDKPEGFKPKGLCCGFIKLKKEIASGEIVFLSDGKRKIKIEIRSDIRPDRTARKPMKDMI